MLALDNAKYHNTITDESRCPTTAWRKADIQNWLQQKGITFSEWEIKPELLEKVKAHATPKVYQMDEEATNFDKDLVVICLPIGHCELNPIELI